MLPFVLLCALIVAVVLTVATLLRRVDHVKLGETAVRAPAEPRPVRAQHATDPSVGVSFRLVGAEVTVSAGRGAPALPALQGRRISVQCAFLADRGAVLTDGSVRWPRGGRRVTATLGSAPGQYAQFCSVQRSDRGSAIAQAVFPAVRSAPDLPG